jgi:hypothetical protein
MPSTARTDALARKATLAIQPQKLKSAKISFSRIPRGRAAYQKQPVAYPDTRENRTRIRRFLLADYLALLWEPATDIYVDQARYDLYPPDRVILQRVGNKLVVPAAIASAW